MQNIKQPFNLTFNSSLFFEYWWETKKPLTTLHFHDFLIFNYYK